ncbi:6-pyruvoyl trahydropterin synthase family protein [Parvularcula oceani]|uniref:6-pyruvoyl trahydropterin synthase family protein n=1 Tax=Parvularcula oceani TaxID=1247963 RepID=UPI0006920CC5|nr:6-carboxytetrahydropterin synthase [Parvularcula oceani]
MYEQSYSFGFEAAHELGANVAPGHDYSHIHGHSFRATAVLRAETLGEQGWVTDFAEVRAACEAVRERLDHRFLNKIEGLERPTLEVLAAWVFDHLKARLPALAEVEVARPTLHEAVRYRP